MGNPGTLPYQASTKKKDKKARFGSGEGLQLASDVWGSGQGGGGQVVAVLFLGGAVRIVGRKGNWMSEDRNLEY